MKKRILSLLIAIFLLVSFTGCDLTETLGNVAQTLADKLNESESSSVESKTTVYSIPTEDQAGNAISIPDTLTNIVSLSPSITQNLLDLGLGDRLVGLDNASASLSGVPADLTVLDAQNLDSSALQQLEAQVVFASAEVGEDPFSQLKEAGICVAYLPESLSLNGVMEDILFLGACTKTDEKAEEIVFSMIGQMNEIKEIAKTVTTPRTVYIETSGPFETVGSFTILNEMVELVGGRNVFNDQQGALTTNSEKVLSLNPDVILTFQAGAEDTDPAAEISAREGWEEISAVANGAIYAFSFDYTQLDQTLTGYLLQIAQAIYPALY